MTIINPEQHREYFDEIKSKLSYAPLTISEMCCLRDLLEQKLTDEREQQHLFTVGHRERENVRHQFNVLCQALEYSAIGVLKIRPERDNGAIKWHLRHRNTSADALLVLQGDDTWAIEPMPVSDRKRRMMSASAKETRDTLALNKHSLRQSLINKGVDLEALGGWKLAN